MGFPAVLLVADKGNPLTATVPKPLVDFCNKTILKHQIEGLVEAGVDEVILAVFNQPLLTEDKVKSAIGDLPVKITFSIEKEPLGTAGAIANCRSLIGSDVEHFLVLHCDIMCEFPLAKLVNFHTSHSGAGTILVTRVEEPSSYGVVIHEEDGKIERFVEKPIDYVGNFVNAGIYCLDASVLHQIPTSGRQSMEHDIFPVLANDGKLFCQHLDGFWSDTEATDDFIIGTNLYLTTLKQNKPVALARGSNIIGAVLVDPSATIGDDCIIGPNVVIGPNVKIGNGARLQQTTLLSGVSIGEHSWVSASIVGWKANVGAWVRMEGCSVLGEGVTVEDEMFICDALVAPGTRVTQSLVPTRSKKNPSPCRNL